MMTLCKRSQNAALNAVGFGACEKPSQKIALHIWHLKHIARHAAKWGDLAPWTEGFTARLMQANDADRDLFDRAFDQFGNVKKTR